MSKISKIFVALAAMTALATPAFAITADFTGFLQVRGFAYDNLDGDDDLDDNARGVDQRFRLWTNTALHENVKAVFAIEVDNAWGDAGVGRVGADSTGNIEIKQLHLDFNIPNAATNIKAGAQYMKFGGGFIQADDASGLLVRYTPVPNQTSFLLGWTKMSEGGDVFDDAADSDYYHLQYDGNFAGWKVSPFLGYMDGAPTGLGLVGFDEEFEAYYAGIETSGKIGPVALAATLVVNDWDNDVDFAGTTEDSGTGIAAWVKGTFVTGALTLSAEGAYYGDSEAGQFINVRGYNNFSEMITGGRFDTRSAMGGNTRTTRGTDGNVVNASYYMNYLYGKLGAEFKLNDQHKLSAFYIYAEEAEDTFGRDSITFGHELDAYYDWAISKGLTFTVGGGYLLADDDFGAGDDAWKLGTAVTYVF